MSVLSKRKSVVSVLFKGGKGTPLQGRWRTVERRLDAFERACLGQQDSSEGVQLELAAEQMSFCRAMSGCAALSQLGRYAEGESLSKTGSGVPCASSIALSESGMTG